ncbi:hypothetical protein D2E26_0270 [Bifidobacterium dolichotidis]|uniref:Uncharacterized protein n=1 Tax=Bifidobacterium dolichotidis TaxID=2306976 RepID=A0A430FS95_9BIFI|nr:hypothetical protein [Bifidobacterium dolichotidis]RSX55707.1 hypothetical protein D2E26_0270 [Bifidobacterium dolichotidis]
MNKTKVLSGVAMAASAMMLSTAMVVPAQAETTMVPTDTDNVLVSDTNNFFKEPIDCDQFFSHHTCVVTLKTNAETKIRFKFGYHINKEGAPVIQSRTLHFKIYYNHKVHEAVQVTGYQITDQRSTIKVSATAIQKGHEGECYNWAITYDGNKYVVNALES